MNQTQFLERVDVVTVARLIDLGFVDTTPLTFTRLGAKWSRAGHKVRAAMLSQAIDDLERCRPGRTSLEVINA